MSIKYWELCPQGTPASIRAKYNIGPYLRNAVRCKKCGQIIRSTHVHDYVKCKCGAIAVDGGSWYLKRSGDIANCEELSERYEEVENGTPD